MNIDPLLSAPSPIAFHAFLAIAALLTGGIQFLLPKGTGLHRVFGYTWVITMAFVALSSFFIWEIKSFGLFSPIHILSAVTLVALFNGVWAARSGNIAGHRWAMTSVYCFGLVIAGVFTLLPGRLMHQVLFGG